jgi:hypothetical protein
MAHIRHVRVRLPRWPLLVSIAIGVAGLSFVNLFLFPGAMASDVAK